MFKFNLSSHKNKKLNFQENIRNIIQPVSIIPLVLLFLVITLSSCSDSPTSTGADLLKDDFINVNELNSLTNSLAQTSEDFKNVISLASSEKLFVGKNRNAEGSSLINFFVSVDTTIRNSARNGSLSILSAKVTLKNLYYIGPDSIPDFTAHRITESWVSTDFTSEDMVSYEGANIATTPSVENDSVTSFFLDNSVVLEWMKHAQDSNYVSSFDYGIILKAAPGSHSIIGYQAISSLSGNADWPHLVVIFQKTGEAADTLSFIPEGDVSVVEGEKPADLNPENLIIQAGIAFNSKVWFDISSIPENSAINYAELTLTVDTLQSSFGSGYSNTLSAFRIFDANNYDSLSSSYSASLSRTSDKISGDVTNIIQSIYSVQQNNGILLTAGGQSEGIELFAIKGSGSSNTALRPQLKIIYTHKQ